MSKTGTNAEGLASLAADYDALLCDIWGVVHNGIAPHASAVDALIKFRAQGGRVILISNAARPGVVIEQMLRHMAIPEEISDGIVTSGDATRHLLVPYKGRAIHHVGPATDHPIFDGLDLELVDAATAEAVVVTGLNEPTETPDDYTSAMAEWHGLGLPMICANPDKFVEVGKEIQYCPGALADIYAHMGGVVEMAGKPYAPIYETAVEILQAVTDKMPAMSRMLAVGDSVRTDATGAAMAGIDFLFITGSIHAEEIDAFGVPNPAAIQELVAPSGARMRAFMPRLIW